MNRKRLRELVYQKFDGHCAYCGKKIELKDMQVDHFVPILRGWSDEYMRRRHPMLAESKTVLYDKVKLILAEAEKERNKKHNKKEITNKNRLK